MKQTAPRSKSH